MRRLLTPKAGWTFLFVLAFGILLLWLGTLVIFSGDAACPYQSGDSEYGTGTFVFGPVSGIGTSCSYNDGPFTAVDEPGPWTFFGPLFAFVIALISARNQRNTRAIAQPTTQV